MKIKKVKDLIFEMFDKRADLLDCEVSVEVLRMILQEEFDKDVDKRQIGRVLTSMGFRQENQNFVQSPIVRRTSVYYLEQNVFNDAKLKYVVKENTED